MKRRQFIQACGFLSGAIFAGNSPAAIPFTPPLADALRSAVDDEARRAPLVVVDQQDNRLGEPWVRQFSACDQQLAGDLVVGNLRLMRKSVLGRMSGRGGEIGLSL